MGDEPHSEISRHAKPAPPATADAAMSVMNRKLDDLTEKFTQLEENLCRERTSHEKNSLLQTALQKDCITLQEQHAKLKTEQAKLHQEMAESKADHSEVLTQQEKLKTEMHNMKSDRQTQPPDVEKLREQQNDILKQVTSLRKDMTSLSHDRASGGNADIAQLGTELRSFSQLSQTNHDKLLENMAKLEEEHSKLVKKQISLQTEVTDLQTNQGHLSTDVVDSTTSVQQTLNVFLGKLQSENADAVLAEQGRLQEKQAALTSDVAMLKADVDQVKTSLVTHSSAVAALETRLDQEQC